MAPGSQRVLDQVIHLVDEYDLYGLVREYVRHVGREIMRG